MSSSSLSLVIPIKHLDELSIQVEQMRSVSVTEFIIVFDSASEVFIQNIEQVKDIKIVLVRADILNAVGKAIYQGVRTAKSKKIIVTMGDGCDCWTDISTISDLLDTFDIVNTTRFRQRKYYIGGNLLKEIVTRSASKLLSLKWRWALTDPTNNFKGYRRDIFDSIGNLRSNGFSFGLEVLVEAHINGFKMIEIDSRWIDKSKSFVWLKRISSYLPFLFYRKR